MAVVGFKIEMLSNDSEVSAEVIDIRDSVAFEYTDSLQLIVG